MRAVFTLTDQDWMTRTSGRPKKLSAPAAAPGAWVTTLITLRETRLFSATSATMIPAETGANLDGFTTTVLPAATGDMTARQDRMLGHSTE